MTDEQILYKAIMKAEKNGYKGHLQYLPIHLSKKLSKTKFKKLLSRIWLIHMNDIIFSHDFAKAFFGDKEFRYDKHTEEKLVAWQFRLQEMVLEKNRVKYLERFL